MANRRDGQETKQKILDAACAVFAEKGYREAKVTEICRRAGANVAAVSYYFGDKASLYVEAWRQVMEHLLASRAKLPDHLPGEDRLRFVIYRMIHQILILDDETSFFRRLELMELANPTGLIDEMWTSLTDEPRAELWGLIRDLLGPNVPEDSVKLCGASIVNQCRGYILTQKSRLESIENRILTPDRADQIAEHITRFSIAGIKAIREQAPSS